MNNIREVKALERKRGQVINALKKCVEDLRKMGLYCGIKVPKGKDNTAYLLITLESLNKYFGRKIGVKLKKLDKDIKGTTYFDGDILVIYVLCSKELDLKDVDKLTKSCIEDLKNIGIEGNVVVKNELVTKVYFLLVADSVVSYIGSVIRSRLKKLKGKVKCDTYREEDVIVIRLYK